MKKMLAGQLHGRTLKRREVSGFILTEAEYPSLTRLPQHIHENGYFCLPLVGHYSERCGANEVDCAPATLAYRGAGVSHSAVLRDAVCRIFVLEISQQWMDRLREESLTLRSTLEFAAGPMPRMGSRLNREFHRADNAASLAIEGLALEMLAEAARRSDPKPPCAPPAWLKRAKEFIHEEFSRTLTLAEIATAVGVHPVHLAAAYKRNYGATIGESVRRRRIEYACAELNGDLPLVAIALRAGFADQSHFSKAFRACVGTTPAKYRRMLRES